MDVITSPLNPCFLQRHSIHYRFHCHGRSIIPVEIAAQKVFHICIRLIGNVHLLSITLNSQVNGISLLQLVQIGIYIEIFSQINVISLITGNNISFQSCRLSRRTFLYGKNSGWFISTAPTMITDNTNAMIKLPPVLRQLQKSCPTQTHC